MTSIFVGKVQNKFGESDKYGFKKLFREINKEYRCPNDRSFLVWKDKTRGIAGCSKCDFTKTFENEKKGKEKPE